MIHTESDIYCKEVERRVCKTVRLGLRIAVVVPCYNVEEHINEVVRKIPGYVRDIILVDDNSQDATGKLITEIQDNRVCTTRLSSNRGVGGATLAGFEIACKKGADIIVKMDGDRQMDPYYLPLLIEPLISGKADYTKGNRFTNSLSMVGMPKIRLIGNAVLSFLAKFASGYWNVFDPANGYIAIRREILNILPIKNIHRRYFFETSMLIALGFLGAVVEDIPMKAFYGKERSNLRLSRVIVEFPFLLVKGFLKRFWWRKVMLTLTMEAIYAFFGFFFTFFGVAFGVYSFFTYAFIRHEPATSGTVMLAALPIIIGFQMLMNAILLEIQSVPTKPLCDKFEQN